MATSSAISLDLTSVPAFRCNELADGALQLAKQLFSLPGVEDEFQRWLAERRSQRGGERNDNKK